MKKLKLKENEVVHCATLKQAKKVLKIAHKLGIDNALGFVDKWNDEKKDTCYNFNKGFFGVLYSSKTLYMQFQKEIISSKEFIKRHKNKNKYKALGSTVSATNESKNGWYKWKDTNYLMYHDFESHNKFGFGVDGEWYSKFKALGDLTAYTKKATHEEIERRLIEEAKKRGFKGQFNYDNVYNEFWNNHNVIMKDGVWAEAKPYNVQQPQICDVVKAWDDDKSEFVYGVLEDIYSVERPYVVSDRRYKNIEKVTEISINDFKK